MIKALFVSHDNSYTGAPTALLRLLHNINGLNGMEADILLLRQARQEQHFGSVANKVINISRPNSLFRRVVNKVLHFDISRRQLLRRMNQYQVIFFNSAVSLNYFTREELHGFPKKALLVYEMPVALWTILGKEIGKLRAPELIFSPTPQLTMALQQLGVDPLAILPLHQYLNPDHIMEGALSHRHSAKKPTGDFHVGMIGVPAWPKAVEYFLCIARDFNTRYPDARVKFVWKGINPGTEHYEIYNSDVQKAGLQDTVLFEGKTERVSDFYEKIDVLALSSREDTFPYIMMEAALFEKPTVCFDQSGGAVSFVQAYGGFVVPFLAIEDYCEALYRYYTDENLLKRHGREARDYILKYHSNPELIRSQFTAGLSRLLSGISVPAKS